MRCGCDFFSVESIRMCKMAKATHFHEIHISFFIHSEWMLFWRRALFFCSCRLLWLLFLFLLLGVDDDICRFLLYFVISNAKLKKKKWDEKSRRRTISVILKQTISIEKMCFETFSSKSTQETQRKFGKKNSIVFFVKQPVGYIWSANAKTCIKSRFHSLPFGSMFRWSLCTRFDSHRERMTNCPFHNLAVNDLFHDWLMIFRVRQPLDRLWHDPHKIHALFISLEAFASIIDQRLAWIHFDGNECPDKNQFKYL